MKFSIKREELIDILSDFSGILKENSVKPVIAGIHLAAKENLLTFTGTNLEVDLIRTTRCKIEEEGVVVIKSALILEYIKLLNTEMIDVSLKEDILYVHSAEFSVLEASYYPQIDSLPSTRVAAVEPERMKEALEKVKFCASQSTDNLAINVVRINFAPSYTEFVATDSFRMVYLKEEFHSEIERGFSLPIDSANSLIRLMKYGVDAEVEIGCHENYLIFRWKDTYFAAKLIELPFPNYSAVLTNASFSKFMEFNNAEIKSSLRKVISIAKSNSDLKFGGAFDFKGKKLEIKASSGNAKVSERVNMLKTGEDFKASLNAKFILEFTGMLEKNVILKGNDSQSMFQISEAGNEKYLYILMPLAVR